MMVVSITLVMAGLLLTGVCLPMIYGRLPMNAWYGMRTKNTFQSQEAWTHLNEVGGMLFSLLGFPLILGGLIGLFLSEDHLALIGATTSLISLLSCGFAAYLFVRYSNRYAESIAGHRS